MILNYPFRLILLGVTLLLVGVILPLLIVVQVIESTFFLNFIAYIASVSGFLLGIIGLALYVRHR